MKDTIIKISLFTEKANHIIQFIIYFFTLYGAISLAIYFKISNINILKNIPEFLFLILITGILNLTTFLIISLYYLSPNLINFITKDVFKLKNIDDLTTINFVNSDLISRTLTKLIIIISTPLAIASSYFLSENKTPDLTDKINFFGIITLISIFLSFFNKKYKNKIKMTLYYFSSIISFSIPLFFTLSYISGEKIENVYLALSIILISIILSLTTYLRDAKIKSNKILYIVSLLIILTIPLNQKLTSYSLKIMKIDKNSFNQ